MSRNRKGIQFPQIYETSRISISRAAGISLKTHKENIERVFGGLLEWRGPEGVRLGRIIHDVKAGGYRDEEAKWPPIPRLSVPWCGSRMRFAPLSKR
jgi:hypothetical protein